MRCWPHRWPNLRSDQGQTLVLFAVVAPVLCAFAGLMTDGARAFGEKRRVQNAADAAALAAAQDVGKAGCGGPEAANNCVRLRASEYVQLNLTSGELEGISLPLPKCTSPYEASAHPIATNCYSWPYYRNGEARQSQVEVRLRLSARTMLAGALGLGAFEISGRAVASATPMYSEPETKVTAVQAGVETSTTILGQFQTAIFSRSQRCDSFFIPGSNVVVSGVETFGGIGNINSASRVNAIRMNYDYYSGQSAGCSYPGAPTQVPRPPEFWCYNGANPCGGFPVDDWPVPFPDRSSLFRSADTRCLYMNQTKLSTKELSTGQAKVTMAGPHCLQVGDTVTVSLAESRYNCTNCVVTAVTGTAFSYAKSFSTFSRTVTQKKLQSGIATLTLSGSSPALTVGDIVTVAGVDSTFNGTYTVTAAAGGSVSYAKTIPPVNVAVTNKALAAGVATLTTSVAHNMSVGDTVTVSIGDDRFDGTYQVTAVTATTFKYSPTPVVRNVTSKSISAGVATLTTSAPGGMAAGDTVTVSIGDKRFDGTFVLTGATSTTLSYTPPTVANTSWTWNATTRVLTQTVTTPPHSLGAGDTVTISGFGGSQTCLNGTFDVLPSPAPTSSTFSYTVPSSVTCSPGTSGSQNSTATVKTVASASASGTAATVTVPSTASSGTAAVPGFIASSASGGTVSFTGNVAATAASGTITSGASANATVGNGWTATHPPGIYVVDAGNGVGLTISAANTLFDGYTFVAPEITVSGAGNTFKKFPTASQSALFFAYDPNGDAVHVNGTTPGNNLEGSIFCGPATRPTPGVDPSNKCWFGGNGTTFTGLMEAWRIEYTATNAVFNGTGPKIGPGTATVYATTTNYEMVTTTTPATATQTVIGLDE